MDRAKIDWRPHFDADAMKAANVEPTIRIGSFVYVGRLHSAPEWFAWNEQLQRIMTAILEQRATPREVLGFYHAYFRDIFPSGLFRRGVPFWAPDVADSLLREPYEIVEEAFERFFERQAHANGARTPRKSPSTSGISSSASTSEVPAPVGG